MGSTYQSCHHDAPCLLAGASPKSQSPNGGEEGRASLQGIRLYWTPGDIEALRERLLQLGYSVSEIVDRDYGQTEFFVTDDDGYSHCFGIATNKTS